MPRGPSRQTNRNARSGITTESRKTEIYSCGKWNLRATQSRKARGQVSLSKPGVYKPKSIVCKRKHSPPPSPPSAASVTASNRYVLAAMDTTIDDTKMWGPCNTEKFLLILLEEMRKNTARTSKKINIFSAYQWTSIRGEMDRQTGRNGYTVSKMQQKLNRLKLSYNAFVTVMSHTGLGWDPITQTVTASEDVWQNYLKEKPQAAKFRNKGLPHFDLLNELYGHTQATGAFAQPSTLGAPNSDEGGNPGDGLDFDIDLETLAGSRGKRKSSGGGSSSVRKSKKQTNQDLAWERIAVTQEYKQQYYRSLATQNSPDDPCSVKACVSSLHEMKAYVTPPQLGKAVTMLSNSYDTRQAWMAMDHDMRMYWLNSL